ETHHLKFIGRSMKVLFETEFRQAQQVNTSKCFEGFTDNYIKVVSGNKDIVPGEFLNVHPVKSFGDYVWAD
ncbi:MAG TPA: hypothetical protein DDZ89_04945, partial [Clostridiales bacterium]|nr:hypothetical protein [Clostridiales bacterium]